MKSSVRLKCSTSHGRHCHNSRETKDNKSSQNAVTLLHNPFLSFSQLHIWVLPNWFYPGACGEWNVILCFVSVRLFRPVVHLHGLGFWNWDVSSSGVAISPLFVPSVSSQSMCWYDSWDNVHACSLHLHKCVSARVCVPVFTLWSMPPPRVPFHLKPALPPS